MVRHRSHRPLLPRARRGLRALAVLLTVAVCPAPGAAQPAPPAPVAPATAPASQPAASGDPFVRLRASVPIAQLGPLRSVRVRNPGESTGGTIKVMVKTAPKGANVTHGGRRLGETPLTIVAERNSTPMDIVITKPGYMILRTRIMRRVSRTYAFKLSPAKIH